MRSAEDLEKLRDAAVEAIGPLRTYITMARAYGITEGPGGGLTGFAHILDVLEEIVPRLTRDAAEAKKK